MTTSKYTARVSIGSSSSRPMPPASSFRSRCARSRGLGFGDHARSHRGRLGLDDVGRRHSGLVERAARGLGIAFGHLAAGAGLACRARSAGAAGSTRRWPSWPCQLPCWRSKSPTIGPTRSRPPAERSGRCVQRTTPEEIAEAQSTFKMYEHAREFYDSAPEQPTDAETADYKPRLLDEVWMKPVVDLVLEASRRPYNLAALSLGQRLTLSQRGWFLGDLLIQASCETPAGRQARSGERDFVRALATGSPIRSLPRYPFVSRGSSGTPLGSVLVGPVHLGRSRRPNAGNDSLRERAAPGVARRMAVGRRAPAGGLPGNSGGDRGGRKCLHRRGRLRSPVFDGAPAGIAVARRDRHVAGPKRKLEREVDGRRRLRSLVRCRRHFEPRFVAAPVAGNDAAGTEPDRPFLAPLVRRLARNELSRDTDHFGAGSLEARAWSASRLARRMVSVPLEARTTSSWIRFGSYPFLCTTRAESQRSRRR